jgi:DNA repair exonuclease SbcCD ATPase subunit
VLNILEKLTARRSQREVQSVASWAQFVADVTDERMQDADAILSELERLQKTPEELVEACELLTNRRAWAAEFAAGEKSEAAYPGLQKQLEDSEAELKRLVEEFEKKQLPLHSKIEAARSAISKGADAKRRLTETVGRVSREAVFGSIEAELEQARRELAPLSKRVHDRQTWIARVEGHGNEAATDDVARLPAAKEELKQFIADEAAAQRKLNEVQARHNAAFAELLKPELI